MFHAKNQRLAEMETLFAFNHHVSLKLSAHTDTGFIFLLIGGVKSQQILTRVAFKMK
jgi:hypothetical protein